jgi:hypothetical protein
LSASEQIRQRVEKVVAAAHEFRASVDDALLRPTSDRPMELRRQENAMSALCNALDVLTPDTDEDDK